MVVAIVVVQFIYSTALRLHTLVPPNWTPHQLPYVPRMQQVPGKVFFSLEFVSLFPIPRRTSTVATPPEERGIRSRIPLAEVKVLRIFPSPPPPPPPSTVPATQVTSCSGHVSRRPG